MEMFLAQAVKQQQLWFRAQPPERVMQTVLDESLSAREGIPAGKGVTVGSV